MCSGLCKTLFYRASNSILGKIGRIASEVTLQLINSKCIPLLLYNLKEYPLNKSQLQSLDFAVKCLYIKLFNTSDISFVKQRQDQLNFSLPSIALERRWTKFITATFLVFSLRGSCRCYTDINIAWTLYFVYYFITIIVIFASVWWNNIFEFLEHLLHEALNNKMV